MEIITGAERRCRWRDEDKLRIVAEAEAPGAVFALVVRRHEISRGQLWKWRGQVRHGELVPVPMEAEFIPVRVMARAALSMPRAAGKSVSMNEAGGDPASQPRPTRSAASRIEIVLPDGTTLKPRGKRSSPRWSPPCLKITGASSSASNEANRTGRFSGYRRLSICLPSCGNSATSPSCPKPNGASWRMPWSAFSFHDHGARRRKRVVWRYGCSVIPRTSASSSRPRAPARARPDRFIEEGRSRADPRRRALVGDHRCAPTVWTRGFRTALVSS